MSAQEAAYRLLSIPMKQLSRSIVFLNTNASDQIMGLLKPLQCLEAIDDNDEDICHRQSLVPTTLIYYEKYQDDSLPSVMNDADAVSSPKIILRQFWCNAQA